jgi:hypothetical protein
VLLGDSATFYRCTHISKDSTWTSTNVPNLDGGGYSPWDSLSGNVFLKDSTDNVGIGTNNPNGKLEVIGMDSTDLIVSGNINIGATINFSGLTFPAKRTGFTGLSGVYDVSNFGGSKEWITGYTDGARFDGFIAREGFLSLTIRDTVSSRYEQEILLDAINNYLSLNRTDKSSNKILSTLLQDNTILRFGGLIDSLNNRAMLLELTLNSSIGFQIGKGTNGIYGGIDVPLFIIDTTGQVTIKDGTQADGYVFTSDANGDGTWQDKTGYGEMGFGDSLRTIAITQNVFSVVTNSNNTLWSTAAVDLHNVTYSGDSLIIDSAGTYQVNIQLSMDGTSGSVIRLGVFLNGVLACSCTGYQELLNNRIIQLTYINIDALNAGDVLQVVITNTANNDDVDAIGGKLMVNKIR